MSDERWTIVDRLFDAALEREPHERAAFLDEACADDEALRRAREGLTRVTNVPTLAERAGDFSRSFDFFGQPVFVRDPFRVDPMTFQPLPCNAQNQSGCFPGNVVPLERQSAIGRAIAALYPAPNRSTPFANFVSSPTQVAMVPGRTANSQTTYHPAPCRPG